MMLVSDADKKAIDHYINDIPEYEDEDIDEDEIDYLLDLEFECFREREWEYQNTLGDDK